MSYTKTEDNTGLVVVSTSGARFKRIVQSEYVHVTWFGAKGDGATDDMKAIQLAINTVHSTGGGTVFFPRGTYVVSPYMERRILLRSDVNLQGEGDNSVIKVRDNAGDYWTIFGNVSESPERILDTSSSLALLCSNTTIL